MRAVLLFGLVLCNGALACNPTAPVPPVLEGHEYDEVARTFLIGESPTIAVARFSGRLELTIGDASQQSDYSFEVTEGWRKPPRRRLVLGGYWIPCELELSIGGHYLLYLEGERPLYILPAERAAPELTLLGDLDWFYDSHGTLIRPELVNEVEGDSGGEPPAANEQLEAPSPAEP